MVCLLAKLETIPKVWENSKKFWEHEQTDKSFNSVFEFSQTSTSVSI